MKAHKIILAAALLLSAAAASAQGVKVYTHDGQVTDFPYTNLDSIVAYGSSVSAPDGVVAVDLGLPSGTKWASANVSATSPEGYGDYFQFGETTPCTDQSENVGWNSSYTPGGTPYKGTSYSDCGTDKDPLFTDGILYKDSLGNWQCNFAGNPKYDAATANWGATWQTPTHEQQTELSNTDYCTWTWTTLNGVKGYEVKSKTNGNSIFLPAAGRRSGTTFLAVATEGLYASSQTTQTRANRLVGLRFNATAIVFMQNYRYFGYTVRAVTK